ncbi:DUF397 domain-containing protein [Streptomyces sp. NPDC001832]|uniref:DUF397 domain-containing protein n=1 Tax=Streptomyces sp. NPDC001832 TaxID=3154527 RepID=UPI00331B2534
MLLGAHGYDRDKCGRLVRGPHAPDRLGGPKREGSSSSPEAIHVRDSKDQLSPELALSPTAWDDFVPCAARS